MAAAAISKIVPPPSLQVVCICKSPLSRIFCQHAPRLRERHKLACLLLVRPVTDAAPRKKVGTIADTKAVFLVPADKLEVLIFGFHRLLSRMALRTCFS